MMSNLIGAFMVVSIIAVNGQNASLNGIELYKWNNAKTTSSGVYEGNVGARAIDGNKATEFHSTEADSNYLKIDFGETVDVAIVRVLGRPFSSSAGHVNTLNGRYKDVELKVGNQSCGKKSGAADSVGQQTYEYKCPEKTLGSSLTLTMNVPKGLLEVAEIYVYGVKQNPTNAAPDNQEKLQCNVPGKCCGPDVVFEAFRPAESFNECSIHCNSSAACKWFTFKKETTGCLVFSKCEHFDKSCTECVSAQKGCSAEKEEIICNRPGSCIGKEVGCTDAKDSAECVKKCSENKDCEFFTFLPSTGDCIMTADCTAVDTGCTETNCKHGESKCYQKKNGTVVPDVSLLVIGGKDVLNLYTWTVEQVDMTFKNQICSKKIPNFLGHAAETVGAFINGTVVVCSGFGSLLCHSFDHTKQIWVLSKSIMTTARSNAAGFYSDKWWITGGSDALKTEIYTEKEGFQPFINLPEKMNGGKSFLFKYSQQSFVLLYPQEGTVWRFNSQTEKWTKLPDMLTKKRFASVGLVTYPDGKKAVIVAGGEASKTSEIFDIGSSSWYQGPDLPVSNHLNGGSSVQYDDSFLIVGGRHSGNVQNEIFKYDTEIRDWKLMDKKLEKRRSEALSIIVPSNFLLCN